MRSVPATVRQQIDAHAAAHGSRPFLISPELEKAELEKAELEKAGLEKTLTFGQLKTRADEIGARLDGLGIAVGAKVAFLLDNGAQVVPLFLGIMANNRVVVPLNAVAGPTQLQHVLTHSDTEMIFVAPRYREKLAQLLARIKPARDITVVVTAEEHGPHWPESVSSARDARATQGTPPPTASDPALLLYTSGSTGLPKGAVLSHGAVLEGGRNVAGGHGLSVRDRALCVLPVYHINGAMVTVCAPLVSGGSVVMPNRFSASAFWPLAAKYRCTWCSVVPTIINYLLDRADREPFDFGADPRLKNFRFGRSASAPLPVVVLAQWERVFRVPIIETLGLTETAGTVATNPMPPAPRKPGSVGMAFGTEIKIIDQHGGPCAANTAGEIVIRGSNLLAEYYKDPEVTRSAFVDGWFRTGDLGLLDDDNYLFITGRLKELILRGGENIAPREIDDALYQHEAVLEAAAVGVAHRDYGQEVVACVALRQGFRCTEQELKEFCLTAVGKTKAPKTIYFLEQLPKGPSGKILRLELPGIIAALKNPT